MRAVRVCSPSLLFYWAWSDFPTGGGAPGLSLCVAASLTTLHDRHMYSERSFMLVNMSQISTTLAFRHSALPCQTISCNS